MIQMDDSLNRISTSYSGSYGKNTYSYSVNNRIEKQQNISFGKNLVDNTKSEEKKLFGFKEVVAGLSILTACAIGCDFLFFKGKNVKQLVKVSGDLLLKFKSSAADGVASVLTSAASKSSAADEVASVLTEVPQNHIRLKEERYRQVAAGIVEEISDDQIEGMRKLLEGAEEIELNGEIIRHATTSSNADIIRTEGYDILHSARNNGSNNFGGMDVEMLSLKDFGQRYGDTKLEYEFSGKAIKLTNKMSSKLGDMLSMCEFPDGDSFVGRMLRISGENSDLYPGDIKDATLRYLLKQFGYDAIMVAPKGESLFLTILDPNNTKGLKYIRTFDL